MIATSWSKDDVLAIEKGPIGRRDIYTLSMQGRQEMKPLLVNPQWNERGAKFSPNGKWIAFTSDRVGNDEVWVMPYPAAEPPTRVSIGGGREPVWKADMTELFYRNGDALMAVSLGSDPRSPGQPQRLFTGRYSYGFTDWSFNYDVAPDGSRFVMVKEGRTTQQLQVLINYFDKVRQLAPTKH